MSLFAGSVTVVILDTVMRVDVHLKKNCLLAFGRRLLFLHMRENGMDGSENDKAVVGKDEWEQREPWTTIRKRPQSDFVRYPVKQKFPSRTISIEGWLELTNTICVIHSTGTPISSEINAYYSRHAIQAVHVLHSAVQPATISTSLSGSPLINSRISR
jgi:hypothetical protein